MVLDIQTDFPLKQIIILLYHSRYCIQAYRKWIWASLKAFFPIVGAVFYIKKLHHHSYRQLSHLILF